MEVGEMSKRIVYVAIAVVLLFLLTCLLTAGVVRAVGPQNDATPRPAKVAYAVKIARAVDLPIRGSGTFDKFPFYVIGEEGAKAEIYTEASAAFLRSMGVKPTTVVIFWKSQPEINKICGQDEVLACYMTRGSAFYQAGQLRIFISLKSPDYPVPPGTRVLGVEFPETWWGTQILGHELCHAALDATQGDISEASANLCMFKAQADGWTLGGHKSTLAQWR